ncbi:hypothetical protein ACJX0J_013309, partial [Zea mays]
KTKNIFSFDPMDYSATFFLSEKSTFSPLLGTSQVKDTRQRDGARGAALHCIILRYKAVMESEEDNETCLVHHTTNNEDRCDMLKHTQGIIISEEAGGAVREISGRVKISKLSLWSPNIGKPDLGMLTLSL